jgi:hypothetical protein
MDKFGFDFLNLPAELRVRVYVYYMQRPRTLEDQHGLNICFLNRQVRAEFEDETLKVHTEAAKVLERRYDDNLSFRITPHKLFRRFRLAHIQIELRTLDEDYLTQMATMTALIQGFLSSQLAHTTRVRVSLDFHPACRLSCLWAGTY